MAINRQQRRLAAKRSLSSARARALRAAGAARCVVCEGPADGPSAADAVCDCGCGSSVALLPPGQLFCQHCGEAGALFGALLLDEGAGDELPVCLADLADFLLDGPGSDLVPVRTWRRIEDRASRDLFRAGLCSCARCLQARGRLQ